jgi:Protein of unknown function, DUF481
MPYRRLAAGVRAAGCVLALAAAPATAVAQHGKVDRIELNNGDVITAEVRKLARGKLTVKTDGLGTISIEWDKVVRVTSPATYEVEVSSGDRYFGTITSTAPGQMDVGDVKALPLKDVIRLVPLDANFWRQLDGSISAGLSYTQANDRTQWSLDSTVTARSPSIVTQISFDSLVATEEDNETENRQTLTVSVQRSLRKRWFFTVFGQGSKNDELGLEFRGVAGAGGGRWLLQSNETLLSAFAGVAYTRERYTDEPGDNRAEALTGFRWDWFTFRGHELDITWAAVGFLDLQRGNRVRAEVDGTVSQKIVKDFKWGLSVFESFNSAPPTGEKKNDLGVTLSFGWTF